MKRVLDGDPSDHDAFVCDFTAGFGLSFRAVTYNAAKHAAPELRHLFDDLHHLGAGVRLLQEIKRSRKPWRRFRGKADPVAALRTAGLHVVYAKPEFATVLDPQAWEVIRSYRPLMSPTKYWTMNYALVVVARHRRTGLVGKFINVHPPAHIQAPKHPSFPVVSRVAREWKVSLDRIARRNYDRAVDKAGGIDFVLSGGDENFTLNGGVDLDHLEGGPLTIVDPPKGTRGGRKIDRFRTCGLQAA